MRYPKLTALTETEALGNGIDGPLEVLQKYGRQAAITDIGRLTGANLSYLYCVMGSSLPGKKHLPYDESLKGITGTYITQTCDKTEWSYNNGESQKGIVVVNYNGDKEVANRDNTGVFIRPVIHDPDLFDLLLQFSREGYTGVLEVDLGMYCEYAVRKEMQKSLDVEFRSNTLRKTTEHYTFMQYTKKLFNALHETIALYENKTYDVYEYKGKKYVRVEGHPADDSWYLTNGEGMPKTNEYYWLEVTPYTWLMDIPTKTLVGKNCLTPIGPLYKPSLLTRKLRDYDGNFEKTLLYKYMNDILARDLFQSESLFMEKNYSEEGISERKSILESIKDKLTPNNPIAAMHEEDLRGLLRKINCIDLLDPKREEFMIRICDAQNFYNAFYKDINTQAHEKKLEFEELCRQLGYDIDKYINNVNDDESKKRAI